METRLFDYTLPKDRIAQASVEPRDHARLLRVDRMTGALADHHVFDLPSLLEPGDLLAFNDSKVFKARFVAEHLPSGTKMEIFFHRPLDGTRWEVLAKPGKRLRPGDRVRLAGDWEAEVIEKRPSQGTAVIALPEAPDAFFVYSDLHGDVPIPPYVAANEAAKQGYQTVYAKTTGSVAAPTAGFHFTEELLARLDERGIKRAFVTLHVGIGTFRPMQGETLGEHVMHEEWGHVPAETVQRIHEAKAAGRRVIAVGTTATRALESAASSGTLREWSGFTSLFITPGYTFRAITGLITNFHLPKSTLLVLVSAFAGIEPIKNAYAHAIAEGYRFYSFGDAMCIV